MLKGKMIGIMAMIATLLFALIPAMQVNAATSWNLVWSDEFNGTSLDSSNWTYEIGGGGWGNNELEYYTNRSQNVQVTGGNLIITAQKESYGGMNYTSGRIKTQGLRQFKFGKIEARIKLPTGQGLWPAFWMLGSNFSSVGWPKCGEIDIMERVNKNSYVNGTVHWDSNGYASYGNTSGSLDFSQYHVYNIEWDTNSIKWFVDGVQFNAFNISGGVGGTEEFQNPFFIILNLAVGGNWPGSPDGSTPFPSQMLVDYVRVYQASASSTWSSLKSMATNQYVSADNYGNNPLIANRTSVQDWEKFNIITNGDGTVSLLALVNNKYVTADLNQSSKLIAQATSIQDWEKFRKIDNGDGTVSFRAVANNMYVSADLNTGSPVLYANRTAIGSWEKFVISPAP